MAGTMRQHPARTWLLRATAILWIPALAVAFILATLQIAAEVAFKAWLCGCRPNRAPHDKAPGC